MEAGDRLSRYGRRAWALLGIVGVAVVVGYVARHVGLIIGSLVLALFPAALLSPLTERLRRTRVPDSLTALAMVLLFLLAFALPGWLVVPRFVEQAPALGDAALRGLESLRGVVDWSKLPGGPTGPRDILATVFSGGQGAALERGVAAATAVVRLASGLVLMLVVLFFCLKDGRRLWEAVLDMVPRRRREEVDELGAQAWWNLGAYLRGQLLVALFDAVFIGLGLWLLGVPLALPLAVLVFFGALFPIVGAFLSGSVAILVALAERGLTTALLVLLLLVVVQQVEGNVFQPLVMSNIIGVHPLVVVLGIVAGGMLLGVFGAFIAVPFAAVVARVVDHVRGRAPAVGPGAA